MATLFANPKHRAAGRNAASEALTRFGKSPDPLQILQAFVDSYPGSTFREHIDHTVLFHAARRALAEAKRKACEIPPP